MIEIRESLREVIYSSWPMVLTILCTLILLRMFYIFKNNEKIIVYKEILYLLFFVYILFLFQIVTSQDYYSYGSNFSFFKELTRYKIGSRLFYRNIIGNIMMFIPFGFFSSCYLNIKKVYLPFLLTLFVSIIIESIQLSIGRAFDVDDIILNLLGGFIGYLIYLFFNKWFNKLNNSIKNLLVMLLFVLIIILFFVI